MAIVLHHSKAEPLHKLILLGIANHDGDGGAFPSVATLAKYANVSERTLYRALGEMRANGDVVVHSRSGGTRTCDPRHRPNLYEIPLTCPPDCDRTKHHRTVDNSHPDLTTVSGRDGYDLTESTLRPDRTDLRPDSTLADEPSLEPSKRTRDAAAVDNSQGEKIGPATAMQRGHLDKKWLPHERLL